ncbi:MAG: hypothetical protein K6A73_08000 [Bacteroidales bacterium]|nr:hypothetical protein [Bacteroidales bacterium]
MKKLCVFIIALAISLSINAQSYDKLWKEFDDNIENLLPESANKTLDKIEKQAKKDKNDSQLLKMVVKRCEVFDMTNEKSDDTIVAYCKSYLTKLSEPSQVILNCEIAKRTYKFDDILEYADNDIIKTVSMKNYAELFQNGTEKIEYNIDFEPTLYDYVMHCLISHYSFDKEKELYEKLLAFDLENNYIKAYYNNRIRQLGGIYDEENFNQFSQLAAECTENELVAKIKVYQIRYLIDKKEYVRAKDLCEATMAMLDKDDQLYKQCNEVINSITKKSVSIELYNVYVPDQAIALGLTYRNTTNPSYKIYKVSADEFLDVARLDDEKTYKKLLAKTPVIESTLEIPEETDYKEHSSLIALPALQNGQYYIVFSNNNSFKDYDDLIYSTFQVSNLSYFHVDIDENTNIYIVNRETGAPIKDVVAHFSERKYSYKSGRYERTVIGDVISDKDGLLTAPSSNINSCYVDLYYKNDTLVSNDLLYLYKQYNGDDIKTKAEIFTDRAIYRPGQTVQFSCVVYQGNSKNKEVFANYKTLIEFRDSNNQIIDTLDITTDEFGSASGSFLIPSDRVSGNYFIREQNGSVTFKVEKYKRPTFEITFDKPEQIYKVGDSVTVSGKVAALSGFGLDNVKYRYTVTRKTTFPFRFWDWTPIFVSDKTISTGECVTLIDGTFNIDFLLVPSSNVNVANIPNYVYEVTVEATNKQGETQSGSFTVRATYNKYVLALSNDNSTIETRDFKNLDVTATNINGIPSKTNVECKIFKINDIERYQKDLGDFDRQLLSNQELKELFPYFDYYYKENITKDIVYQQVINVDGKAKLLPKNLELQPAKYVVELRSLDDTLSAFSTSYVVFDIQSKKTPVKSMCWTNIDKADAQPGETINYYIGSSEKNVSALVMVKRGSKILKTERITLNNNIFKFSYKVKEEDHGRLDFQVALTKFNTEMRHVDYVDIPYNNMDLNIVLHTERDKILPGGSDTWSVTVKDYMGKPLESSMIATMYDASLDDFGHLSWYFNTKPAMNSSSFIMTDRSFNSHSASQYYYISRIYYDEKPMLSTINMIPMYSYYMYNYVEDRLEKRAGSTLNIESASIMEADEEIEEELLENQEKTVQKHNVKIRKDFNETAFFFPNLRTDKNGDCTFTFTMPDALTRWNLKLLAYSKDLKVGSFEKTIVTQQPLMIMADMPRFAYDEDTLWLVANVINLSDKAVKPSAKLEVFDDSDNLVDLIISDQHINMEAIPAGQSRSVRWKVAMQKDLNILKFRFSAITDGFSDAEQHEMPVLSTDIYMTQTFTICANAHDSVHRKIDLNFEDERNHKVTLHFNENPLWAAIHAMPYVSEGDEKYAITAFYRYFVNTMVMQIMESHPEIAKELENTYKNDTLSELQKYEDLKAIILQETPWVMEAQHEAAQRVAIAKLFDKEAVSDNIASALNLLGQKQTPNGGWSWIDGCPESVLITQHILSGLGQLGIDDSMTEAAFHFIENEVVEEYNKLDTRKKRNSYHCDWTTLRNLYAMSFFSYKTSYSFNKAEKFYVKKLKNDWKHFSFEERAYIALILNRNGQKKAAMKIVKSLREFAEKKEYGMYWMNWHGSSVLAETRILEAFNEIDPHIEEIDAMRLWILTNKRTNMWENERASAEAILALVNTGSDWTTNGDVTLTVNGKTINSSDTTLYEFPIQMRFLASLPISIENNSDHVAWGALYRQYFVPIDKVQQHKDEVSVIRKLVFDNENPNVGDKVIIEITFENDQDMEFVYLKDLRGACFEPKEQISQYHWDDGLWYYQSTSDVAMEFFFEYLPKGKHTVSYEVYVTKEGSFSAGYSLIQCQYAPEFGAYSNGSRISVNP